MRNKTSAPKYDCSRCPGYCCSYPRIELLDEDVQRLADHFGISFKKAERKFAEWYAEDERILQHRTDTVFNTVCRFFDRKARRCTVYEARPTVCRSYPNGNTCGYYTFLKFERRHQDDPDFIPSA